MEADVRYYWRRAVEELAASRRSVTEAARERHDNLARLYLDRLNEFGAALPYTPAEIGGEPSPQAA